jgi:hypothetical protein
LSGLIGKSAGLNILLRLLIEDGVTRTLNQLPLGDFAISTDHDPKNSSAF